MSFIRIIRPINCIFVLLCVFAGAYYKQSFQYNINVIWAGISATLIAAAGYVANDIIDVDIDKINKPQRVLPSRQMSISTATIYAIILAALGIYVANLIGDLVILYIAIINGFALFIYALSLKQVPLAGNLVVSLLAGSTMIYGALSNGSFQKAIPIAVIAFVFTLIREIVKDAEDIYGDSSFGAKTIPILFSRAFSLEIVGFLILTLLSIIIYLFLQQLMSVVTMVLLIIFVIIPMFFLMTKNLRSISTISLRNYSTFIKIDMLILLIIVFFGAKL